MRAACTALVLLVSLSCASAVKDQRVDAGIYGAQLLACVELSDTREESRACRERVMKLYGRSVRLAPDAGAVDGGKS